MDQEHRYPLRKSEIKIWVLRISHGSEHKKYCLKGYDTERFVKNLLPFQRNPLPPPSG
jgi:hypothetical protein